MDIATATTPNQRIALTSVSNAARRASAASRSSVYRWIAAGLMTPVVRVCVARVGIPEHEFEAILKARAAGANDDQVRDLVAQLIAARPSLNEALRVPGGKLAEARHAI